MRVCDDLCFIEKNYLEPFSTSRLFILSIKYLFSLLYSLSASLAERERKTVHTFRSVFASATPSASGPTGAVYIHIDLTTAEWFIHDTVRDRA
jgi:hypothetical protein